MLYFRPVDHPNPDVISSVVPFTSPVVGKVEARWRLPSNARVGHYIWAASVTCNGILIWEKHDFKEQTVRSALRQAIKHVNKLASKEVNGVVDLMSYSFDE